MKNYLLLSFLLLCCFLTNSGYADFCEESESSGIYTGLSSGALFDNSSMNILKTKSGYYIGGSLGYKFSNSIRLEAEFAYQRYDASSRHFLFFGNKGHVRILSYMANAIYDFDFINFIFKPYLGMGIGYGDGKIINSAFILEEDGLAWQAIAGIRYQITNNVSFALEYRYFQENVLKNNRVGVSVTRSF